VSRDSPEDHGKTQCYNAKWLHKSSPPKVARMLMEYRKLVKYEFEY
jgi:hypothetical protein